MKKIVIVMCLVLLTGCTEKEEIITEQVGYTTHYDKFSETIMYNEENPRYETKEEIEKNYILNINSLKFHTPNCISANRLLQENREEIFMKRQDAIDLGYSVCGNCNSR